MPSGPFRLRGPEPATRDELGEAHADYWLRVGKRELLLDPGETLIGRDDDCHIVVADASVSRRHAVIFLESGHLSIEDLESANGTFLNEARAYGRVPLTSSDRITIGSCVIEVVRRGGPDSGPADEEDRPTPTSGIGVFARVGISKPLSEERGVETARGVRAPIVRLEEFEAAGRLADRMLALGRTSAAEQILAEPIMDVLAAARKGDLPGSQVIDAVGRYGIKLANATLDARWADAAIELHLLVARPFRMATLRQLATLRSRTLLGDDALIARYYETVRSRLGSMDSDERILATLIADLIPGLGGNR